MNEDIKARYRNKVGKIVMEVWNGEKWLYVRQLNSPLDDFKHECLAKLGIECLNNTHESNKKTPQTFGYYLLSELLKTGTFLFFSEEKKIHEILKDYKNVEEYVISKLKKEGYNVETDIKYRNTGHPDLIVKKDNLIYYVEIKSNGDGIHYNQIRWLLDNPYHKVLYYWITEPKLEYETKIESYKVNEEDIPPKKTDLDALIPSSEQLKKLLDVN